MNSISIEEPKILVVIERIIKNKRPLIVSRALTNYYRNKINNAILYKLRNESGFNESLHRRLFNKNHKLNTCTCKYCIALKEYVAIKISKHRVKKRLYYDSIIDEQELNSIFNDLAEFDILIRSAKREKDSLLSQLEVPVD